jgi:hypothetical protein
MKIKYDIAENRDLIIEAFELKNMDEEYKFFYDETNNIRKFRFKEEGGLNIPVEQITKNFVLGGIAHKKDSFIFNLHDFNKFMESLYIDEYIKFKKKFEKIKWNNTAIILSFNDYNYQFRELKKPEFKLKHIAKGNLLNCLKSKKLQMLFDWILANDLNIHFSSLNILYWSIVDIIDSCIEYYPNFRYEDLNYFKTVFYELAKVDLESFLKILHKYKYPNIQKNKVNKFIIDIKSYIFKHKDELIHNIKEIDEHSILVLADILRNSNNSELVFIQNNDNYMLIDGFAEFYMRPLGLFKNSQHIFDEEVNIIDYFNKFEFYDGDQILNHFKFEKSHNNSLIQVSDIVVGILGKYNEFINELQFDDIPKIKNNLNTIQKENFAKLFELCKNAELTSKAFTHYMTALTNIEKERLLSLEFIK